MHVFDDAWEAMQEFFPQMRPERAIYLVNFSVKWRFLYVETPKVGCSSVKSVLQRIESGDNAALPENVHDRSASPLASPESDLSNYLVAHDSPDYVRFSFVRNPFTRVLSCYLDKFVRSHERGRFLQMLGFDANANISFKDFLLAIRSQKLWNMDIHYVPQSVILAGLVNPTFIGRFENFERDLNKVVSVISNRPIPIQRQMLHATNAKAELLAMIGPEEQNLIIEIYENDFINYGYSKDIRFVQD